VNALVEYPIDISTMIIPPQSLTGWVFSCNAS
jgi:hypothetical protein